ncbi:hypothetical protein HDF26_001632 [Pedobacter cryoconitis]|uniref:eCIS core domain-containing protein n=1 Tax=Pedobacter cryoconitis TaxID=188932 RepID=UPI001811550D|nr:DUF4157 domain-containing protein [Pedobacter cryoconitis]MBB6271205.1 hypothetical protein [Pedobacter cryoconitis]
MKSEHTERVAEKSSNAVSNNRFASNGISMPAVPVFQQPEEKAIQMKSNNTGLPDQLKSGVEQLSGYSLDDVNVHYNSNQPAQLNAHAFAQGENIHIAPGQERHLPHEAWHVVQQKQGRVQPTLQMKGIGLAINDNEGLESEADVMGGKALNIARDQSLPLLKNVSPGIEVHQLESVIRPNHGIPEINLLPDSHSKKKLTESLAEKGVDAENAATARSKTIIIAAKEAEARASIRKAIDKSEDTIELSAFLETIKNELNLIDIMMVDLGTAQAAVKFHINPWFIEAIPSGKVIWRMIGTGIHSKPITDVHWESESLTIGTKAAMVGKRMIAEPLAPDHEPGSKSTVDSDQTLMMAQLANAGNTSVSNHSKYIKGHLLNDHVGGPGESLNLFPITADANAKHLAFVEKYIKAQISDNYVLVYEIVVSHDAPVKLKNGQHSINAKFNFHWQLMSTAGIAFLAKHQDEIQSVYENAGDEPFDIPTEYNGLFFPLNSGKSTPNVIPQPGQMHEPSVSSPAMVTSKIVPTSSHITTMPSGFLGSSSSAPPPIDYTGNHSKLDTVKNLNFISTRKPDLSLKPGSQILVAGSSVPVTVVSLDNAGGGWIRIYYK